MATPTTSGVSSEDRETLEEVAKRALAEWPGCTFSLKRGSERPRNTAQFTNFNRTEIDITGVRKLAAIPGVRAVTVKWGNPNQPRRFRIDVEVAHASDADTDTQYADTFELPERCVPCEFEKIAREQNDPRRMPEDWDTMLPRLHAIAEIMINQSLDISLRTCTLQCKPTYRRYVLIFTSMKEVTYGFLLALTRPASVYRFVADTATRCLRIHVTSRDPQPWLGMQVMQQQATQDKKRDAEREKEDSEVSRPYKRERTPTHAVVTPFG